MLEGAELGELVTQPLKAARMSKRIAVEYFMSITSNSISE